jgi:hypothetical protein
MILRYATLRDIEANRPLRTWLIVFSGRIIVGDVYARIRGYKWRPLDNAPLGGYFYCSDTQSVLLPCSEDTDVTLHLAPDNGPMADAARGG